MPAVVSGGLLLLFSRLRAVGALALGVASAAGLIAAQAAISQWPTRLWPIEGRDWLPWIAGAAVLIGGICAPSGVAGRRRLLIAPLRLLAACALPWVLLQSYIEFTWSTVEATLWIAGQALGLLLLWFQLERTARLHPGALMPATLLIVSGVSAVVIGLSGTALFAQLTGALAAALGPVLLLVWLRPATQLTGALVPAVLLPLSALWITGAFYADVPPASGLLLAVAPLLLSVRGWAALDLRPGWLATLLTVLLVLLPLAVALTLAILAFEPDPYGAYK